MLIQILNKQRGGCGSEAILLEERDAEYITAKQCPLVPWSRDANLHAKWCGSTVSDRYKFLRLMKCVA